MPSGTVKRVVYDRGFGVIRDDSGHGFFFHRSAMEGDFTALKEGQRVDFDEETSTKGPRANHVRMHQHTAA